MLLICMLLQQNHHQKIEAVLENTETKLERFVLTAEDFRVAQKDQKEITLGGKIYDIKEIIFHDGTVELLAYHDSKEQGLISLIEKFFDDEGAGSDFQLQVLKMLVTVYTFSSHQFDFSQAFLSETFFDTNSGSYLSFDGETLTPPPDEVS